MSQEYLIGLLFWFVLTTIVVLIRVFLPVIRYRLHRAAAAPPLWVLRNYLRRTGVYRDYVDSRSGDGGAIDGGVLLLTGRSVAQTR